MSTVFERWQSAHDKGEVWSAPVHEGGASSFSENYELQELLGHGAFGEVHRAKHRATGKAVAVKIIAIPGDVKGSERSAYEANVRKEMALLCKMSHPHIISVIEAFAPPSEKGGVAAQPSPAKPIRSKNDLELTWRVVLELCMGHELQSILDAHGALDVEDVRVIAAQLVSAVHHMHENGGARRPRVARAAETRSPLTARDAVRPARLPPAVVHRDIKPANVMVLDGALDGPNTRIKILDFGLAHGLDEQFVQLYRDVAVRRASQAGTGVMKGASRGKAVARAVAGSRRAVPSAEEKIEESHAESGSTKHRMSVPEVQLNPSRFSFAVEPAGSRMYAAPEIQDYHRYKQKDGAAGGLVVATTVVVDAYSVGAVLRHLLTGVPPDRVVRDFISQQRASPIEWLIRVVKACAGKPVVHYRYLSELPEGVADLLSGLLDPSPRKRTTITQLCDHPWIRGAPGADALPFPPLPQRS